jgi:sigma-E factor negative regulatory protein RseA
MNANAQNEKLKEQISGFVDGEIEDQELDFLLSALRAENNQQKWETYHQIGDILNSDDLSISLSDGFNQRLQERLAGEIIYAYPKQKSSGKYGYKVAYATAAVVALIAILVPKFAGHDGAEVNAPYSSGQFVAATNLAQPKPTLVASSPAQNQERPEQGTESRPRMLRDPQLDSYLAAHQRYSKSMYSAVEYETGPISQEVEK